MATIDGNKKKLTVSGEEIESAVNSKHEHSNSAVLDKLSDNNGTLQYNGADITGGSASEITASKVKMADNTTVEDNVIGLKHLFFGNDKELDFNLFAQKVDADTGELVSSNTTFITEKMSLSEYNSITITCQGVYTVNIFEYDLEGTYIKRLVNVQKTYTLTPLADKLYILQFWKNNSTDLSDINTSITINAEFGLENKAKEIAENLNKNYKQSVIEVIKEYEPVYLVTNYGIDKESGDNSQALQNLINRVAGNGGGIIKFSSGEFKFSILNTTSYFAIQLLPNVSIEGLDKNLTKFIMNESDNAYSLFWRLKGINAPLENAHFKDFTVDASALTTWNVRAKAFYAQYVKNCNFENLNLIGTPATAMGIDFLDKVEINSVNTKDCGHLWEPNANKTGSAGIGIGCGGYENENFTISNCICEGSGQYGIFVESQKLLGGSVDYEASKGMNIINNIVRGGLNHGIGVRNGKGITVVGNTTYENTASGIYVEGGTDINICGNQSNGNGVNGILVDNSSTSLSNKNISIIGNQTAENTSKGVSLNGAIENLYVNGNAIFDSIENNATVTGVNTVQTA